jgi:enoyl-[acyl-carrier-protein] reductase (NADH)
MLTMFRSAAEDPYVEKTLTAHPSYIMSFGSLMPSVPTADSSDISDAVIYLASDMSRVVTGTRLTVDMGATKV